jgi:hypothetical protein
LYQVEFYRADLQFAKLDEADLKGAKFHNSDLRGASLASTDLYRVDFIGTILSGANFSRARCSLTTFAGVDLTDAQGLSQVLHKGPSNIDVATLIRSASAPLVTFFIGAGVPETFVTYARSLASSPIEFYSCFISYSHADNVFASRLHAALEDRGIRCWLDEKQLAPGDDIYEEVDRGIRLWDKVLLCCSRASLSSWWVDNEIGIALEKEQQLAKERGGRVRAIVPLNLDGHMFSADWKSGYSAQLRRRLAADFTDWSRDGGVFETELQNLIRSLRADERAREQPPHPKL